MSRADPRVIAAWKRHRETILVPAGNGLLAQAKADAARCRLPVSLWARQAIECCLAEQRCRHVGVLERPGDADREAEGP